jgi:hypothetical protein
MPSSATTSSSRKEKRRKNRGKKRRRRLRLFLYVLLFLVCVQVYELPHKEKKKKKEPFQRRETDRAEEGEQLRDNAENKKCGWGSCAEPKYECCKREKKRTHQQEPTAIVTRNKPKERLGSREENKNKKGQVGKRVNTTSAQQARRVDRARINETQEKPQTPLQI